MPKVIISSSTIARKPPAESFQPNIDPINFNHIHPNSNLNLLLRKIVSHFIWSCVAWLPITSFSSFSILRFVKQLLRVCLHLHFGDFAPKPHAADDEAIFLFISSGAGDARSAQLFRLNKMIQFGEMFGVPSTFHILAFEFSGRAKARETKRKCGERCCGRHCRCLSVALDFVLLFGFDLLAMCERGPKRWMVRRSRP